MSSQHQQLKPQWLLWPGLQSCTLSLYLTLFIICEPLLQPALKRRRIRLHVLKGVSINLWKYFKISHYLCVFCWLLVFCFIQQVIKIHYYHLFWSSDYPQFDQRTISTWPFFDIFLPFFKHFLAFWCKMIQAYFFLIKKLVYNSHTIILSFLKYAIQWLFWKDFIYWF